MAKVIRVVNWVVVPAHERVWYLTYVDSSSSRLKPVTKGHSFWKIEDAAWHLIAGEWPGEKQETYRWLDHFLMIRMHQMWLRWPKGGAEPAIAYEGVL